MIIISFRINVVQIPSHEHIRVLNIITPPQYDPNMEPVTLPVVSEPNTRNRRNFKTTRKGMQIVFVGLYVAEPHIKQVKRHLKQDIGGK